MKKNKSPKKNKSLKVFNLVAKRVHKLSKKQGLGFKWQDSQKFTSANVFQKFKGKPASKIKVTEIDKTVNEYLDSQKSISQAVFQKPKEYCADPRLILGKDIEPVNWWSLPDVVDSFDPELKIAIKLDGIVTTGIIKKKDAPDLKPIRETFRKNKSSSEVIVVFKVLKIPNASDNQDPCSFYVLITIEDSADDENTRGEEIDSFMTEEQLSQEEREKRFQKKEAEKLAKQKTKSNIKKINRPHQIEIKPSSEQEKIEIESEKYKQLNLALEGLRQDFKDKLISKKQYQELQKIIFSKFEMGGKIK